LRHRWRWRALSSARQDRRGARRTSGSEPAYWAQLPRSSPPTTASADTSRNLAGLRAIHNFPSGRADGNHWGKALTVFRTSAGSPYHFSLHASDRAIPSAVADATTGHTFICGHRIGKDGVPGFLRQPACSNTAATQVLFDKDRGLEILVRALGGEY